MQITAALPTILFDFDVFNLGIDDDHFKCQVLEPKKDSIQFRLSGYCHHVFVYQFLTSQTFLFFLFLFLPPALAIRGRGNIFGIVSICLFVLCRQNRWTYGLQKQKTGPKNRILRLREKKSLLSY